MSSFGGVGGGRIGRQVFERRKAVVGEHNVRRGSWVDTGRSVEREARVDSSQALRVLFRSCEVGPGGNRSTKCPPDARHISTCKPFQLCTPLTTVLCRTCPSSPLGSYRRWSLPHSMKSTLPTDADLRCAPRRPRLVQTQRVSRLGTRRTAQSCTYCACRSVRPVPAVI